MTEKSLAIHGYIWLGLAFLNLAFQFSGADTGYAVFGSLIMAKLSWVHADIVKKD